MRRLETDWNKEISKWTGWLIGFLALASFVLSYEALWTFALDSGIVRWLAWLWPLTLDFFVLVASLSILRNSLNGEPRKYAWAMVIVFTLLSIAFNAIHKGLPLATYQLYILPYIPIVAFVLPPVAFVFSFHLGMAQIESTLSQKPKLDKLDSPTDKTPEIGVKFHLSTENEDSTEGLDKANEARQAKVEGRRAEVVRLVKAGLSEAQIAEALNVSPKTIGRDIKTLEQVKSEGTYGRNGNGKARVS